MNKIENELDICSNKVETADNSKSKDEK